MAGKFSFAFLQLRVGLLSLVVGIPSEKNAWLGSVVFFQYLYIYYFIYSWGDIYSYIRVYVPWKQLFLRKITPAIDEYIYEYACTPAFKAQPTIMLDYELYFLLTFEKIISIDLAMSEY